ncbi:hypothetical protein Mapa_013545 [Marchantia paleacea]|nr:hypothetical protein Mapa_013545 [Marchantia paleacea]
MGSLSVQVSAFLLIVSTVITSVAAAPEAELVTNLPGLPTLGFKIYSGYVTVDEEHGRALFYYFVEAQFHPQSKPLTLWLNGGPGCSSLMGNFVEHGPFTVRDNAIVLNPSSWNQESNVLYLESPAGVGFSYSNTTSDYTTNDEKTAQDSFKFLQGWVEKFPEYQNRTFYITGESYSGYYVPQLAALIVKNNSSTPSLQLKGIMIGNPVIDIEKDVGYATTLFYLWTHGQVSDDTFRKVRVVCGNYTDLSYDEDKACSSLLDTVFYNETGMFSFYNVLSDTCPSDSNATLLTRRLQNFKFQIGSTKLQVAPADPCHTFDMEPYLNRQDVQAALHAHIANASYGWTSCSQVVNYNVTTETVEPLLKLLIANDIRVWVYSGDQDSVIPFTGTRRTVESFSNSNGLRSSSHYQPWYADKQIGGWTVSYGSKLLYATVRGAGHMVPLDQPVRALQLFNSFLLDSGLPLGQA